MITLISQGAGWRDFALSFATSVSWLRWLLLDRAVIDSDGFQSRRRQFEGERLSGLVVPAPDRRTDPGLDFPHQACCNQLLGDLPSGAALDLLRRRQAMIVALRR